MEPASEIVYAFIDSQNLKRGVEQEVIKNGKTVYSGWELDYKKFRLYLFNKYNVTKALLFIGKIPGNEPLYHALENFGYALIYRPTLQYVNSAGEMETKGNVDSELVLHTMIEFNNYDKAIIVAGDGDYFCLAEHLENNDKLKHIMIPNKFRYSRLLNTFIKYIVFVSDLKTSLKR